MLKSVLNIDLASARRNDFTGAHDHYDLCFMNLLLLMIVS